VNDRSVRIAGWGRRRWANRPNRPDEADAAETTKESEMTKIILAIASVLMVWFMLIAPLMAQLTESAAIIANVR
jgi:hypothetical protein